MRGMSGIRAAAAMHVMLSLMAWSVAVTHEDDSAAAAAAGSAAGGGGGALLAWGLQDQTAAVGRLFELQLPSTENRTAFTVSTSPGAPIYGNILRFSCTVSNLSRNGFISFRQISNP